MKKNDKKSDEQMQIAILEAQIKQLQDNIAAVKRDKGVMVPVNYWATFSIENLASTSGEIVGFHCNSKWRDFFAEGVIDVPLCSLKHSFVKSLNYLKIDLNDEINNEAVCKLIYKNIYTLHSSLFKSCLSEGEILNESNLCNFVNECCISLLGKDSIGRECVEPSGYSSSNGY